MWGKMEQSFQQKLIEWVESSSFAIKNEIPQFAEDLLRYGLAKSIFFTAVLSVILCAMCGGALYGWNLYHKEELHRPVGGYYWNNKFAFLGYMSPIYVFFMLILLCTLLCEITTILQISLAPKIYCLEYVKGLVK